MVPLFATNGVPPTYVRRCIQFVNDIREQGVLLGALSFSLFLLLPAERVVHHGVASVETPFLDVGRNISLV